MFREGRIELFDVVGVIVLRLGSFLVVADNVRDLVDEGAHCLGP